MNPEALSLFPVTTGINSDGELTLAGHRIAELADQFTTPLYLYDGETIRQKVQRLNWMLREYYPGPAGFAYASKAYFSYSLAQKMAILGVGADVVSLGEIRLARQAGFSPRVVHLHGNNKTRAELEAALEWGIESIVVDSLDELAYLEALARSTGKTARIWLRITPDLNVDTHPHIETSHAGSKFGLHVQNGDASKGIRQALASSHLELTGLHMHLGSQIFDPQPYRLAIEKLLEVAQAENYIPKEISPGGGWGVRYTTDDPDVHDSLWVKTIAGTLKAGCDARGWPLPRLVLEPGRWLIARAGVAVYRIGSQKTNPDGYRIVAIDGGLADNPRVALYGAHYTARLVCRPAQEDLSPARVVGKFCESGDVLIPEIQLPTVHRDDLLAVPVSGAYQLSMSSNYNFAARPPVLWLESDRVEVMQCCEQPDEPGWWVYQPG